MKFNDMAHRSVGPVAKFGEAAQHINSFTIKTDPEMVKVIGELGRRKKRLSGGRYKMPMRFGCIGYLQLPGDMNGTAEIQVKKGTKITTAKECPKSGVFSVTLKGCPFNCFITKVDIRALRVGPKTATVEFVARMAA